MFEGIKFIESNHTYWLNDRRIPSVTEILGHFFNEGFHGNEDAMWRGNAVHKIIHYYEKGTINWDTVDPSLIGYFEAYTKAKAEMAGEVIMQESIVYNNIYKYAGTLDALWKCKDFDVLVDFKTGNIRPWHTFQLQLYSNCVGYLRPRKLVALELHDDGSYCPVYFNDTINDRALALSLPGLYNWKMNNNLIGVNKWAESKSVIH